MNMKKIIVILLASSLCITLISCKKNNDKLETEDIETKAIETVSVNNKETSVANLNSSVNNDMNNSDGRNNDDINNAVNNIVTTPSTNNSEEVIELDTDYLQDENIYTPLSSDEIARKNKSIFYLFKDYFNKASISIDEEQHATPEELECWSYLKHNDANGGGYSNIVYEAKVDYNTGFMKYSFTCLLDENLVRINRLYVEEPYEILTGKSINSDVIDKINKLISEAKENKDYSCNEILESRGNFEVCITIVSNKLDFIISTGGSLD